MSTDDEEKLRAIRRKAREERVQRRQEEYRRERGIPEEPAESIPDPEASVEPLNWKPWALLGLILVIIYQLTTCQGETIDAPAKKPPPEYNEFIREGVRLGVWLKVTQPAVFPYAYTGPTWATLNVDEKAAIANGTLAHYVADDSSANMLMIFDGMTGKKLGEFGPYGLKLE